MGQIIIHGKESRMPAFESRKFSWRKGYSYRIPADVVGSVLEDIEEKEGKVTSGLFLEYSRPEGSRTHGMFEWDDTVAAEKYRLTQASRIINQLEVSYEVREEDTQETVIKQVSAFVNVNPKAVGEQGAYMNIVRAKSDDGAWEQVIRNALAELKAFRTKYASLKEFGKVFEAIAEAEAQFDAQKEEVKIG